jgi:rod shape-determining protein MreD
MGRAWVVAAVCLLAVRVQFGLLNDAVVADPLFIAAVHAAVTLRGSHALWLAALVGLTGDWLCGLPMGLQGAALTLTAYLAFRASRHLMITRRHHLFLLALLLFGFNEGLLHALNLALGLRLSLGLPMIPSALLSSLTVAALGIRHEERNPV